ncbi:unnamed protein product [Peniophora sp. CBMAI 1063]|nr:unnamed protein product [Peniophora sp. CBMAI 1063]
MGSSTSTLSVAVAIVGAVGYGVYQYTHPDASASAPAPAPAIAQGKIAGSKKKGKSTAIVAPQPTPAVVGLPPVTAVPSIPGEFDSGSDAPGAGGKAKKPKKKKGAAAKKASALTASEADATSEADSVAPPPAPAPKKKKSKSKAAPAEAVPSVPAPAAAAGDAEAWTRVESKKGKKSAVATPTGEKTPVVAAPLAVEVPEASVTTTTGSSNSPVTERTTDEEPAREPEQPAAESKVKPAPGEQPAKGFTWEDYEGVDADADSDWGVVSSKKPRRKTDDDGWTTVPSRSRPASAAGANKPGPAHSESDEPTKKQRQNAAKRDAQKAAKEEAERERLARLAKHKRELERVRSEQFI